MAPVPVIRRQALSAVSKLPAGTVVKLPYEASVLQDPSKEAIDTVFLGKVKGFTKRMSETPPPNPSAHFDGAFA